jgi:hypothetical protein
MRSIGSVKNFDRHLAALALPVMLLLGCASPTQRMDREAQRSGLTRSVVVGTTFRHVVYTRPAASNGDSWTVYLESDGLPWINGRAPAADPTSREPLALQLMMRTQGAALYVTRPCYHELMDAACSWQAWTSARYSASVVESMTRAIETKLGEVKAAKITLVGYSGGGALAALIAERLRHVDTVITIAANLDTQAWTSHHRYLPLSESLNPAKSELNHLFEELHLLGSHDTNVPPATTRAYFERYPNAKQITFDDFDHVCCWVRDWEAVRAKIGVAAGTE